MTQSFNMTEARRRILASAKCFAPAVWVVSSTGERTGFERASWSRNCKALAEHGYLEANAHGDWYLTEKGKETALEDAP